LSHWQVKWNIRGADSNTGDSDSLGTASGKITLDDCMKRFSEREQLGEMDAWYAHSLVGFLSSVIKKRITSIQFSQIFDFFLFSSLPLLARVRQYDKA
tara:strand:- start:559 stop:852 length:294 start_codon:yes stop_codon:yes gene_type:complete